MNIEVLRRINKNKAPKLMDRRSKKLVQKKSSTFFATFRTNISNWIANLRLGDGAISRRRRRGRRISS